MRSFSPRVNFAHLAVTPPDDYILGPQDTLDVLVLGLDESIEPRPIRARIMADGTVRLPLVGAVRVAGLNLAESQRTIDEAYTKGRLLVSPRVSVSLAEKATINIAVIGEVANPGVYALPKYEDDVTRAIASAGGLTEHASEVIEIHRRIPDTELAEQLSYSPALLLERLPSVQMAPNAYSSESSRMSPGGLEAQPTEWRESAIVIRIPLRGQPATIAVGSQVIAPPNLTPRDISVRPGDTVVVPRQPDQVFFVVGPVDSSNSVIFSVTDRDRRLGNAFILPNDRDIDVVTAVAMAGYIDPIDSPSTVTVHRSVPGQPPMLVRVDLIKARYDWNENLYVQAGDIIYLNPDAAWWWRRTFDRVVPELFTIPYGEAMELWINPFGVR